MARVEFMALNDMNVFIASPTPGMLLYSFKQYMLPRNLKQPETRVLGSLENKQVITCMSRWGHVAVTYGCITLSRNTSGSEEVNYPIRHMSSSLYSLNYPQGDYNCVEELFSSIVVRANEE